MLFLGLLRSWQGFERPAFRHNLYFRDVKGIALILVFPLLHRFLQGGFMSFGASEKTTLARVQGLGIEIRGKIGKGVLVNSIIDLIF